MVLCALLGSIGATLCAFAYWGIVIVSLQSKDAEEEEECAGRYYWRRERNRFITFTSRRAPKGKLPGPLSLSRSHSQYYSISTHSNNNLSRCSAWKWASPPACGEQQNGAKVKSTGVLLYGFARARRAAQSKNCHCEFVRLPSQTSLSL